LIAAACGDDEEPAPAPAPAAPAVDTAALEAAQADAAAALAEASAAAEAAAEAEAALEAALAEAMAAAEGQVDPEAVAALEAQLQEAQAAAEAAEAEAMAAAAAAEAAQAEAAEAAATAEEAAAGPTDPCGGENETSTVTIMMDWLAYWSWAALVAADDQGYYAEEGLKVDIIAPPSAAEPLKMLGELSDGDVEWLPAIAAATCTRVPVIDGHLVNLSLELAEAPALDDIHAAWRNFRGPQPVPCLPSAPERPLQVFTEVDRPQIRLDRMAGKGMSTSVGRLRECPVLGYRFAALTHNTIRGAAGCSILNAELLAVQGYLGSFRPEPAMVHA